MKKLLLTIIVTFLSSNIFANTLDFKSDGKMVKSFSTKEITQGHFEKIKASELTLFNAWRGYERTYVGYNFFDVLDSVYSEKWRKAQMIKFIATDGFVLKSTIQAMLKASEGRIGFLAYKEKNMKGFSHFKKGEKEIDPGPFYLVWSNFHKGDKVSYGDILQWPYQLTEIEISRD